MNRPTRCIDPCMKYCQGCKYGVVEYYDVDCYADLDGASFDEYCMWGLEDTIPTQEEIEEFERWVNKL